MNTLRYQRVLFCLAGLMLVCQNRPIVFGEEIVVLNETFNTLENWEPFYFPKISAHSTYTLTEDHVLKTESRGSASAIIFKTPFNVYQYPRLTWRWQVENIYQKGDAAKKSGDDYPLRLYVMFAYDPAKAGLGKKFKYTTAKILYGKYPPHSTLNYIWANREQAARILTNPYASEAKMIVLQQGEKKIRTWQAERVNILDDYRQVFGEDPPVMARLAIMNDSDNTGEHSISFIDDIKIVGEKPARN
jgi:Protein of unknown function (DUF3047)